MGWEARGGRKYYYRKHRFGARVYSEYVGAGDIADLLAGFDDDDKFGDAIIAHADRLARGDVVALERALLWQRRLLDDLVERHLIASGFHQHKGEWRLRRK